MNKLYIFTLNWNGADKLKLLAPTLIESLKNIDYNWIIKDNNSNDNSIEYINSLNNNKIDIIKYKDNLQNFSEGMNYIFNYISPADSDNILLLNNDIVFNDSVSVNKMINIIENKDVGVVGAKLLYPNSNRLQHAGVVFHKDHKLPYHFRHKEIDDPIASKNRLFQSVTGAVLLTKAEYFKNNSSLKGIDTKYQWAFEDVDLCLSIKCNLNKKIVYCGDTKISHIESATLKQNIREFFIKDNINYFLSKWSGRYIVDHNEYLKNNKYNLYKNT
jgi:GT2 family glycosyltransferase